jgi:hypothetical protein
MCEVTGCATHLARSRDTHTITWSSLVFALVYAGSADERWPPSLGSPSAHLPHLSPARSISRGLICVSCWATTATNHWPMQGEHDAATSEMVKYAYGQIDQARTELGAVSERPDDFRKT